MFHGRLGVAMSNRFPDDDRSAFPLAFVSSQSSN